MNLPNVFRQNVLLKESFVFTTDSAVFQRHKALYFAGYDLCVRHKANFQTIVCYVNSLKYERLKKWR